MEQSRRKASHPARFHYLPRIWSFALCGVLAFLLYQERQLSPWLLLVGVWTFLVWPHLAYHRTRWVRDPKRAELNNLFIDAMQMGIWVALLHYNLWMAFCYLVAVCLNNLATGGTRQLIGALLAYVIGNALAATVYGFHFNPHNSTLIAVAIAVVAIVYACSVGFNYRWQNNRLLKIKQAIESKNQIFKSLLEMNAVTHQTTEVEDLLKISLSQLKKLFPYLGFGVIVHEHSRPAAIRYALFNSIDISQSGYLLTEFHKLEKDNQVPIKAPSMPENEHCYFMPMKGHLKQCDGYLVVKGEGIGEEILNTTKLFTDQIGSALENNLLTIELKKLANTDTLTGIFNRMHFDEEHQQAIRTKNNQTNVDFSIILIDVNGLKEINDAHGHEVGDKLIVAVADLLKKVCRNTDLLVRLGGDEFIILCHGCDSLHAQNLIARIREAERTAYLEANSKQGKPVSSKISLSIGLAGSDQIPAEDVFSTADERMYADKKSYYQLKKRYR